MTKLAGGWFAVLLAAWATTLCAAPHDLPTRTPEGPVEPHFKQMRMPPSRAVPLTDRSSYLLPADGNFQMQPLPRSLPRYTPGFVAAPPTFPQLAEPVAGQLTRTGVAHKQPGLRQMSIDPTLLPPPTITAGEVSFPIRSAPEHSTRLAPGRDALVRPRASYGPHWLMVEVENTPATPRSAKQPGLQD